MVSFINREDNASARGLVSIEGFEMGGNLEQVTIKEINLGESLLTPGLQTVVVCQNSIYIPPKKDFDSLKNTDVKFTLSSKNGSLNVNQKIYRMDNREFMPTNVGQTEEFVVHGCDQTQIEDAKKLVSRSWNCTPPHMIAQEILQGCAGAKRVEIEASDNRRDYIAENIHPFQVVAQQTNVALASGNDPSFVHYMTYEDGGTHRFESLSKMCIGAQVAEFKQSETGVSGPGLDRTGYDKADAIISMSFPCDFDYLSDLLNGLEDGQNMNSLGIWNPVAKAFSKLGESSDMECGGIGGFNYKQALSNQATKEDQDSCNLDVENHLLKRQARMSLLEKDKIALRLVVPWNPDLHAGKVIALNWQNKYQGIVYGSGKYLILSMMHTVRLGGFSTTTIECVSTTVGQGGIV